MGWGFGWRLGQGRVGVKVGLGCRCGGLRVIVMKGWDMVGVGRE